MDLKIKHTKLKLTYLKFTTQSFFPLDHNYDLETPDHLKLTQNGLRMVRNPSLDVFLILSQVKFVFKD